MLYYPPHLRHVATLPREIKYSNFPHCILIASNFVIHPQILIFSLVEISLSPYWLQIKLPMSLFFYLFTFAINCGTENSSEQMTLQCLSTINMVFSNEDKILIKKFRIWTNEVDTRNSCEKLDKAWC